MTSLRGRLLICPSDSPVGFLMVKMPGVSTLPVGQARRHCHRPGLIDWEMPNVPDVLATVSCGYVHLREREIRFRRYPAKAGPRCRRRALGGKWIISQMGYCSLTWWHPFSKWLTERTLSAWMVPRRRSAHPSAGYCATVKCHRRRVDGELTSRTCGPQRHADSAGTYCLDTRCSVGL